MEGTSGAADPGLLRGSSGDAALGPRVAVLRASGAQSLVLVGPARSAQADRRVVSRRPAGLA